MDPPSSSRTGGRRWPAASVRAVGLLGFLPMLGEGGIWIAHDKTGFALGVIGE